MDARLAGLARRFGASYTRYADDLLFSGDEGFARDAARCEVHAAAILLEEGLAAAHRKTRVMRRGVAQRALGLTLNGGVAVSRRERERLEAVLVNCARRGAAAENREGRKDFREHLRGRVAMVAQVNPAHAAKLWRWFERIVWEAPPSS